MTIVSRLIVGRNASTTASTSSSAETQMTMLSHRGARSAGERTAAQPVSAASAAALELVRFQTAGEQSVLVEIARHAHAHGAETNESRAQTHLHSSSMAVLAVLRAAVSSASVR